MCEIVFGDNHLFGINHLSLDKAEHYRKFFSDDNNLSEVFRGLRDNGISEQMLSSHASAGRVASIALGVHSNLVIHPVIPYAHAINDKAAAQGVVKTAFELLKPSLGDAAGSLVSLLAPGRQVKTPYSSMKRFIEAQVNTFGAIPDKNKGTLFINNVFCDLLVGFGLVEWFDELPKVCQELGYDAGVITYNPRFFINRPVEGISLCINHNHMGYLNNLDSEELCSLTSAYDVWAMGVFGSGAYRLDDVVSDLTRSQFQKVVFASSKAERLAAFSSSLKK